MFSLLRSAVRAGDDVEEEIGERMKHIHGVLHFYTEQCGNGLPCRQACVTATDRQTDRDATRCTVLYVSEAPCIYNC